MNGIYQFLVHHTIQNGNYLASNILRALHTMFYRVDVLLFSDATATMKILGFYLRLVELSKTGTALMSLEPGYFHRIVLCFRIRTSKATFYVLPRLEKFLLQKKTKPSIFQSAFQLSLSPLMELRYQFEQPYTNSLSLLVRAISERQFRDGSFCLTDN